MSGLERLPMSINPYPQEVMNVRELACSLVICFPLEREVPTSPGKSSEGVFDESRCSLWYTVWGEQLTVTQRGTCPSLMSIVKVT